MHAELAEACTHELLNTVVGLELAMRKAWPALDGEPEDLEVPAKALLKYVEGTRQVYGLPAGDST